MPTILLGTMILILSVCVCIHIHNGNRELHREMRKEFQKNQDTKEKYEMQYEVSPPESPRTRSVSPTITTDIETFRQFDENEVESPAKHLEDNPDAIEVVDPVARKYLKTNGIATLSTLPFSFEARHAGFLQRFTIRRFKRFFRFVSPSEPSTLPSADVMSSSTTTSDMVVSVDMGASRSPQVVHNQLLS